MPITLKDIEASEKICEAATEGEWRPVLGSGQTLLTALYSDEHGFIADFLPDYFLEREGGGTPFDHRPNMNFTRHARTALPAMNALVREMYEAIGDLLSDGTENCVMKSQELYGVCECARCHAFRLIESMEP